MSETTKRMCCNCHRPIVGSAMTSGGVYWHSYSCLNTVFFRHYAHVDGTPVNPPTTLTTYNSSDADLASIRTAVQDYLAALDALHAHPDLGWSDGRSAQEIDALFRASDAALARLRASVQS